ncbi:uncharacterized protein BYT42DRAFT_280242 [Radiomyces spectabilis]|uniref:uncharacterized protein n=1 Tax=Radiomyces spectabilis TaxID=64574 RepID=UPI00221FD17C|nr:uncharacterized protein BYT42DRAFT_280242 [Radiomyces spectabilis]KAI8384941.1 hypothetical protein BYT42DRAFT_280242 [Radiomyces spectabilis]
MNPLAPIYGAPATQGASDDAKRSRWGNSNREHRSEHSGDETVAPLMKSMSLRRKKSTRDFNASGSVAEELGRNYPLNSGTNSSHHRSDTIRRDDDKRPVRSGTIRGLSRSGTLRGKDSETSEGPLIDCSEPVPFAKGSLLAKEDLESAHTHTHYRQAEDNSHHGPTLINIDDKVKFSKGSLLEKNSASTAAPVPNGFKISRSKSTREYHHRDHGSSSSGMEPAGEHRRHMSLRRKPTNKDRDRARHHDVPLPSTATPSSATSMTASSSTSTMSANKTLLRLDDTPEQSHTRTLLERQMKPLLNFAETDEKARRS